jgi:hypothetical protein
LDRRAVIQGHCHHKAIMRLDADKAVFDAMGLQARVLDSGCCGLAGSFGFEHDKHAAAQACAERALLPALREQPESTLVLADGFSCRTQIEHGSARQGLHLAEALELALDFGPAGPPAREGPEHALVTERQAAVRASTQRALGGVLLALGLLGTFSLLVRRHAG